MADGRDLGFGPTESRDIRSADPKTLPQNQTRSELHEFDVFFFWYSAVLTAGQ